MFNLNCLRNLNKTNNIKIINLVIVLLLLSMLLPAQVIAAQPITVTVNGRVLTMDVSPVVQGGRTLVPMRVIFDALGAEVI